MEADPGETKNLAKAKPAITSRLHAMLEKWRKEVRAKTPEKNPSFIANHPGNDVSLNFSENRRRTSKAIYQVTEHEQQD